MSCSSIGKCIIILVNSFFMLVGLAFAAVGVILSFFPNFLLDQIYDTVKESLDTDFKQGHIKIPDTADNLKHLPFLNELGVALLILGVVLFLVAWLGWCGACCTSCCRCLLLVFALVLLVIVLAETATGAMFLVTDSPLHENLRKELKQKIHDDFNETSQDSFSAVIVIINDVFDCCGVDGVADFVNNTHYSCGNYTEGCYIELIKLIDDNEQWAGLVLAVLLFLQVLEVIFAIAIFKEGNKISPF
ncbi:unnamed protein product [Candidula unifasciata]|uniref:Tetraspanin n=1 Tax=Candidula unifasciata TaxID=100452 RepID=A0A8S3Z6M7_9EUPU|nr:unnamed protein product [Candidula unifasciata]